MWLQEYEGLIEVAFGAVSLLSMLVVMYLNYRANASAEKAIKENQLTQELENRPYVFFYFETKNNTWLEFCLKNVGKGVAKNIKLSIDQQVKVAIRNQSSEDESEKQTIYIQDMAVAKTLSFLPPGGSFEEFAQATHRFYGLNEDLPEITGKIEYQDGQGKNYTSKVHFNLKMMSTKADIQTPDMNKLVEIIERIESTYRQNKMKERAQRR